VRPQPTTARFTVEDLLKLIEQLGVAIRREPLGTDGGGLCIIQGKRVLFVDTAADLATQRAVCLSLLAQTPEFDNMFARPDIRSAVEAVRAAGGSND